MTESCRIRVLDDLKGVRRRVLSPGSDSNAVLEVYGLRRGKLCTDRQSNCGAGTVLREKHEFGIDSI